jgi:xanthine dehydrogenase accessory factor
VGPEKGLALATIVETEGSTPQVRGASAIFSEAGLVAGTVGGGLLEARVEEKAKEALKDGKARVMTVRLDADPSDMEGAICGGAATVLVDPGAGRDRAVFAKACEGTRKHMPGYIYTGVRVIDGPNVAVTRLWEAVYDPSRGRQAEADGRRTDAAVPRPPAEAGDFPGEIVFDSDVVNWPCVFKGERGLTFIEFVQPLPRLIIAGAGHVGRAVARLGRLLDFGVTVIDDRAAFANPENIPEADEIVVGEIGEAVGAIEYSSQDYFVIVTRGHQKDAEALRAALRRPAAYVGMIGSRTKVETLRREFLKAGWATEKEWARIYAPIGLDIGSKTVEEIAVSIAAQLVFVRSRKTSPWPL